jgi:hypothetical protein
VTRPLWRMPVQRHPPDPRHRPLGIARGARRARAPGAWSGHTRRPRRRSAGDARPRCGRASAGGPRRPPAARPHRPRPPPDASR